MLLKTLNQQQLKVEDETAKVDEMTNGHDLTEENEEDKAMVPLVPEPNAQPLPVFPNVIENSKSAAVSAPVLESSFNFFQESQIDLESPHMDPAVVMVHPSKKSAAPIQQGVPPGIPSLTFTNQLFQQLTPAQQQAFIAQQTTLLQQQQQAVAASSEQHNGEKFASSYNSAFDPSQQQNKPGHQVVPGVANGHSGPQPE